MGVRGLGCPHPASPPNARVEVGGLTPGAVTTYACDPGYRLFGGDTTVCGADGKWSGKLPICATNVAYRKPVNQSTTARGGDGEKANDGDASADAPHCSQTFKETSPWWAVDLLQRYEVSVVEITSRRDFPPLQDLEVRVGDSSKFHQNRLCDFVPGPFEEGTTREVRCRRAMPGRYVSVAMVGVDPGSLSLCEVNVFSTEEVSKERCTPDVNITPLAVFNRTCYHLQVQEGGPFEVAKSKCAARGSTLAQHISPETQDFLASELERIKGGLTQKLLWIGLQKDATVIRRTWRWLDGTVSTRPLWARDQPNNYKQDQNCIMMDGEKGWLWNDVTCSLNYLHWICQFAPESCGSPDRAENTTVTVAAGPGRATATYHCPEGHRVLGAANRTCGPQGLWEGQAPSCQYVDCGAPAEIEHGKLVLLDGRTTYAAGAIYECAENYTLAGDDVISCGGEARWLPAPPQCLFSWCPALTPPRNGRIEASGRRAGDSVVFSCDPGHHLLGAKTVSCALGGQWSAAPPTCRFVDCGMPDDLEHGEMTLVNGTTHLSSEAAYECGPDYWLDGPDRRTCLKDGRWTGDRPQCVLISCGAPEIPVGGSVTGFAYSIGEEVQYHCDPGHYRTGERTRVCTREAVWSGEAPTCTYVDCGRVTALVRGKVTYDEAEATHLHSEVAFSCSSHYRLQGPAFRVCTKEGRWSGVMPVCEEITCPNPEVPPLAKVTIALSGRRLSSSVARTRDQLLPEQTYKIGSTASYRCDKGYAVVGATVRTCVGNGTWNRQPPHCKFVDCGHPPPIEHGVYRLLSNKTSFGAMASYECKPNWRLEGKPRRSCLENGTWSELAPTCSEVQCPPLTGRLPPGLTVDAGARTVGAHAAYACLPGYAMLGAANRSCGQHGVWANRVPACKAVVCPPPAALPNGRSVLLNASTSFGALVEHLCYPGHRLRGDLRQRCGQAGAWGGVAPSCVLETTDLGTLGDNSIDGSSNSPLEGKGEEEGGSNAGMIAGILVSIVFIVIVALAFVFYRTKLSQMVAGAKASSAAAKSPENGAVSYGDLSDPTTGNNIYDNIPDDLPHDPNYSELRTPPATRLSAPTYANGGTRGGRAGRGGGIAGYPPNQRPRMPPPPQPPTVPPPSPPVSPGVTINGMAI